MKSGVQMNFLERRAFADRVLAQIVRIAQEATPDALSSREQRAVYRLEAMFAETPNPPLPARAGIGSIFAARWATVLTVVTTLVRSLWLKGRA